MKNTSIGRQTSRRTVGEGEREQSVHLCVMEELALIIARRLSDWTHIYIDWPNSCVEA